MAPAVVWKRDTHKEVYLITGEGQVEVLVSISCDGKSLFQLLRKDSCNM